jgi:hypothetical protein
LKHQSPPADRTTRLGKAMPARKRTRTSSSTPKSTSKRRRAGVNPRTGTDRLQIAIKQMDNGGLEIGPLPARTPSPLEIRRR